jgi:hypothetical protein
MSDIDIKQMMNTFRREISNVNSVKDLNAEVITSIWTVGIFLTIENLRTQMPEDLQDDLVLLETARMSALKHFDLALLDSFGIRIEENH